ncbi:MAG: hypothetical protein AB7F96_03270 [Beijerinckiaceae bacterium]
MDKDKKEPDWKTSLPFPRHWLIYIAVKLVLLAVAVLVTLRLYGLV